MDSTRPLNQKKGGDDDDEANLIESDHEEKVQVELKKEYSSKKSLGEDALRMSKNSNSNIKVNNLFEKENETDYKGLSQDEKKMLNSKGFGSFVDNNLFKSHIQGS